MINTKVIKQINFVVVIDCKIYIKVTDWLAVNYHNIQLSDWWLFSLQKNLTSTYNYKLKRKRGKYDVEINH